MKMIGVITELINASFTYKVFLIYENIDFHLHKKPDYQPIIVVINGQLLQETNTIKFRCSY